VGNATRKLAIECKTTKGERQYISKKQIEDLERFATIFGAEPWVAVRFDRWHFISRHDLQETEENYVISKEFAEQRSFSFEEIQGKF
jgi:Holliday junction resolvase